MTDSTSKTPIVVLGALTLCVIGGAIFYFSGTDSEPREGLQTPVKQVATGPTDLAPAPRVTEDPIPAEPEIQELAVAELHFLPDGAAVSASKVNAIVKAPPLQVGNRRLSDVRQIIAADDLGGFLAPRLSPDGLQILLTRPGFAGIYVAPRFGGTPQKIADGNAFFAEWTADGKIAVREDDTTKIYSADGVLESTESYDPTTESAYGLDDTIYARSSPDAPAQPITGNEDTYIQPQVSPDGSQVAYIGLGSGLFVANADGSGDPVFLGYGGNNVTWTADGGLIFDLTSDDGHNLTEGDIYYVDSSLSEASNLTEGDNLVGQYPTIGPDGQTVAFEAEGGIYTGTIR